MSDVTAINNLVEKHKALKTEIAKVIIGQTVVIDQILLSIYTGGHSLLIGVPGLAKTLMVNTIAQTLGLDFKRIQFTPDLMPSDILGSEVLDQNRNFKFIKGPIFANIILADEINRTPPKNTSGLARGDARTFGNHCGATTSTRTPLFCSGNPEPHRTRRHLPFTGSSARPLYVRHRAQIPFHCGRDASGQAYDLRCKSYGQRPF